MHIAPYNNENKPIVDVDDTCVPLNYFNIVKLKKGQAFAYQVPGYETCIVPATGTVDVEVEGVSFTALGNRGEDVWDGEPEGVYVPVGAKVRITCTSDATETFIAGGRYDKVLEPFDVRVAEIDKVQYGSDDTKTHRKIKHILGQKQHDKVGRLLVSELFTVGQGGWSGFPAHKRAVLRPMHVEEKNAQARCGTRQKWCAARVDDDVCAVIRFKLVELHKDRATGDAKGRVFRPDQVAHIGACRIVAMLIGEDTVKDEKLFTAAMLVRVEMGVFCIADDRRRAGDLVANAVQHLPLNPCH